MTARVPLLPILTVNFIGTLGFSIVLPFLVFLVARWGGNALIYGAMGATYSAFQLVGAPVLGRWSDTSGRRKVLLLSQVGTLVSWIVFYVAFFLPPTPLASFDTTVLGSFTLTLPLIVLFLARALDGITGGNISVANAYLADVTPEEERSTSFGKMAVSSNLGFILGPAIAGLLGASAWGEKLPVLAALFISLVGTMIIAFGLPESRPCVLKSSPRGDTLRRIFGQEAKDCVELEGARSISWKGILRLEGVPLLLALNFLVLLGFSFFYIAFPMHAIEGLGWSPLEMGVYFSILSGLMALAQGPVLGWASRKWSESRLVLGGSVLLASSFVFFLSSSASVVYSGVAFLALGNGLMWPSVVSRLSKAARRYQGAVQGFAGSLGAIASILGLVVGGVLYESLGGRLFLLSAGMIFLVFLLAFRLRD